VTNIDVTLEVPDVSSDEWRRVDYRASILSGHVDIALQKNLAAIIAWISVFSRMRHFRCCK